ncbi:MAG: DUF945 family protein [Thioalkalivibrionaceae bacterium]
MQPIDLKRLVLHARPRFNTHGTGTPPSQRRRMFAFTAALPPSERLAQSGPVVLSVCAGVALALTVVLVAGWIAVTAWIGQRIETELATLRGTLVAHPDITVHRFDYQRGLWSGTLDYDLAITPSVIASIPSLQTLPSRDAARSDPLGDARDDSEAFRFNLTGRAPVRHGPWVGHSAPAVEVPDNVLRSSIQTRSEGTVINYAVSSAPSDGVTDSTSTSFYAYRMGPENPSASTPAFWRREALGLARIDFALPLHDAVTNRLFDDFVEAHGYAVTAGEPSAVAAMALSWRINLAGRHQIRGVTPALISPHVDAHHTDEGVLTVALAPLSFEVIEHTPERFDINLWSPALSVTPAINEAENAGFRWKNLRVALRAEASRLVNLDDIDTLLTVDSMARTAQPSDPITAQPSGGQWAQTVDADLRRWFKPARLIVPNHVRITAEQLSATPADGVSDVTLSKPVAQLTLETTENDNLAVAIDIDVPVVRFDDFESGKAKLALQLADVDRPAAIAWLATQRALAQLTTITKPNESAGSLHTALDALNHATLSRLIDGGFSLRLEPMIASDANGTLVTAGAALRLSPGAISTARDRGLKDRPDSRDDLIVVVAQTLNGEANVRVDLAALQRLFTSIATSRAPNRASVPIETAIQLGIIQFALISTGFFTSDGEALIGRARIEDGQIKGPKESINIDEIITRF